jgi:hypothetical protein
MITRAAATLLVLSAGLAHASAGLADAQTPSRSVRRLDGSLGGSVNPLGVQNQVELWWARPLFSSSSPLLKDAHFSYGLSTRLTPAYLRAGGWVELSPLSVLDLRIGAEPIGYFGTFHHLLPFQGYGDRFDDDTRKARAGARGGGALRLYGSPTVKARVGRLIVRARAEMEWWRASAPGPYFYEPFRDTLLQSSGDAVTATETLALWTLWDNGPRKLLVGPIHDLTVVSGARANRRQDVGLVAIWGLGARRFGLKDPVVFAKVARYLEDPNREGGVAAQLAVGFTIRPPRGPQ